MNSNVLKGLFEPRTRKYLYRVATALMVLLGAVGIISDQLYVPILGLIAAVLATSLADANTSSAESMVTHSNKKDGDLVLDNHRKELGLDDEEVSG